MRQFESMLHNEEFHSFYCSPNKVIVIESRRLKWKGHISRIGKDRSVLKISIGKPMGKRSLERPGHSWEGNIRKEFKVIGVVTRN